MINEKIARKYCRDDISKIENYEEAIADTTQTWDLHHRLELTIDGEFALTPEQLMMHDMYYNRPYYELIFLTHAEHSRLHMQGKLSPMQGKRHTDDTRKKISEALKGKLSPMQGKHLSEESRRKISEANKGKLKGIPKSIEQRRKMSESAKRRWAAIKK